jgi:hypothetical protein
MVAVYSGARTCARARSFDCTAASWLSMTSSSCRRNAALSFATAALAASAVTASSARARRRASSAFVAAAAAALDSSSRCSSYASQAAVMRLHNAMTGRPAEQQQLQVGELSAVCKRALVWFMLHVINSCRKRSHWPEHIHTGLCIPVPGDGPH